MKDANWIEKRRQKREGLSAITLLRDPLYINKLTYKNKEKKTF